MIDRERYAEVDDEKVVRYAIRIHEDGKRYYPGGVALLRQVERMVEECKKEGLMLIRVIKTYESKETDTYVAIFGKEGDFRIGNINDLPTEDPFRQWCLAQDSLDIPFCHS